MAKAPVRKRPLLNMRGASAYTGFSIRQFRRWIEFRKLTIPVYKVNGYNWFDPDDLDKLVDSYPRALYQEPPPSAKAKG